jgi:quercetin dioxygenase-like cupin family protein
MIDIDPKELNITHHFGGGVYIKETHFKAGEWGEKHTHNFDHLSTLASGRVELEIDGVSVEIEGPKILTIIADKVHRVKAITDVVWLCIHATDCTDPVGIDNTIIEASRV